jgi:glutathione S-transferase
MQVPVLHWNGETIAQSMAIARFLAREFGLAGKQKNAKQRRHSKSSLTLKK